MNDKTHSASRKLPWLPSATALLAFVACNGTILLVGLLAVFGITLVINPHIQAAVISLFAILTLVFVFLGYREHRVLTPLALSIAGALLIIGTMYISFNKVVESIGLMALIGAAIWSWRLGSNRT